MSFTLQDRTEINKKLNLRTYFPPFFSVLLPELGRPQYLKKCIESIHKYADMPVEIIVHDDGSGKEKQQEIFSDLRDKISTLILNTGYNTGLARSFNRCRAMASSEYMLAFNTDTYLTSSFLCVMKKVLDLPYVGLVNVINHVPEGPGTYITPEGFKIRISNRMAGFHCGGITKKIWDAAGGWDENVQTTSSDVGFLGNIWGLGLFPVFIEGTVINEMWQLSEDGRINVMQGNPEYIGAAEFTRGDNNCPPLFGIPEDKHAYISRARQEEIWAQVNHYIQQDTHFPFWYNSHFQCRFTSALMPEEGRIDWEIAKILGHDKWKEQLVRDFGFPE